MRIHALHHLYDQRLAQSTRPFRARGCKIVRCKHCMLTTDLCMCAFQTTVPVNPAFLMVMYDDEILKPSNTAKLIADVVEETYAWIWSRTEPNPEMVALVNDPQWQPFVVFPAEYAEPERVRETVEVPVGKRPLFILLDGTWSQAKKMFRKSDWLHPFPVLTINPDHLSRYGVRTAAKEHHLATAEVAAEVLAVAGENYAANVLACWFEVFSQHYLYGRSQKPMPEPTALTRFLALTQTEAA